MKAFTLIELLLAVSIGLIMMAVGSVSINNFLNKQRVDAAVTEITGQIRLAKNYAVTSQSPGGYAGTVEYVGVLLNANGLMTIVPGNNTTGLDVGSTYSNKQIDLSSVKVSQIPDGLLMFSVPEGKLVKYIGVTKTTTPQTVAVNILVNLKDDAMSNGVLIMPNGIIDEKANFNNLVPVGSLGGSSLWSN